MAASVSPAPEQRRAFIRQAAASAVLVLGGASLAGCEREQRDSASPETEVRSDGPVPTTAGAVADLPAEAPAPSSDSGSAGDGAVSSDGAAREAGAPSSDGGPASAEKAPTSVRPKRPASGRGHPRVKRVQTGTRVGSIADPFDDK